MRSDFMAKKKLFTGSIGEKTMREIRDLYTLSQTAKQCLFALTDIFTISLYVIIAHQKKRKKGGYPPYYSISIFLTPWLKMRFMSSLRE